MKQYKLLDVLAELIVRLGSKSPLIFVYIQNIALGIGILFGVLALCVQLQVPLPAWLVKIHSWEIIIEAGLAYLIAKLPVKDDASELPLSK
jgi:hypothetical protein